MVPVPAESAKKALWYLRAELSSVSNASVVAKGRSGRTTATGPEWRTVRNLSIPRSTARGEARFAIGHDVPSRSNTSVDSGVA